MNDTVDASSKYQDSLPSPSDAIMERLDNWEIAYTRTDHVPLRTVEESKKVQGQFLSLEQVEVILKPSICAIIKSATYF
jgi:Ala-tRNA(Pro) deacylase